MYRTVHSHSHTNQWLQTFGFSGNYGFSPFPSLPLLLLLLSKQGKKKRSSYKLPPGPNQLPLIGNLHQLGLSPHHSLRHLSDKHGPLMFLRLGRIPTLVISSADAAREVLKSHDVAFSGRPCLYAAMKLSYGCRDMVFTPYGEYWRQVRKVCVSELLSAKRVQSFRDRREPEVALLVESIVKASSSSSPTKAVNCSVMMLSLVNRITCSIAFGVRYGAGEYEKSKFHELLAETQSLLGRFCISDFFPWMEWVRLERNFKELDEFYDHLKSRRAELNGHEDLVHVLFHLRDDPTHSTTFTTKNHIKGILTDIFIAGTDTSSATLVWVMTELLRNASVMEKVRQDVRLAVGNKGKVEECDLPKLDYLKLVIKETMRLHTPAPLLVPRETTESCKLEEYVIPAKTRVFINAGAICMDSGCWQNPEEFKLERFSYNSIDFRGLDFQFIPFGVGRRPWPISLIALTGDYHLG